MLVSLVVNRSVPVGSSLSNGQRINDDFFFHFPFSTGECWWVPFALLLPRLPWTASDRNSIAPENPVQNLLELAAALMMIEPSSEL